LLAGEPRVEPQFARQVARPAAHLHRLALAVEAEDRGAARCRPHQVEEKPDSGALPGAVRPQEPEDLTALDAQVQVVERDLAPEDPGQPARFDCGNVAHGLSVVLGRCAVYGPSAAHGWPP